jgi:hypothetical protein
MRGAVMKTKKDTCAICGVVKDEEVAIERIEMIDGDSNTEHGILRITKFNICKKCFEKELSPWFREKGIEPIIEEVRW